MKKARPTRSLIFALSSAYDAGAEDDMDRAHAAAKAAKAAAAAGQRWVAHDRYCEAARSYSEVARKCKIAGFDKAADRWLERQREMAANATACEAPAVGARF